MDLEYQGEDYTRQIENVLERLGYQLAKIRVERLADRGKNIPNSTFILELINSQKVSIPGFLKIGSWLVESRGEFSRGLENEEKAYLRLQKKHPNGLGFHYAGMIQSRRLVNNIGFLLLNWINLSNTYWRDPKTGDEKIVKKALLYLEEAGIVHLDIVQNLKIKKDGKGFFWMDFERMVLDESYQNVYDQSIDSLARRICQSQKSDGSYAMIPTPSPKKQRTSRVYSPDHLLDSPSSPSRRNLFGSPSPPSSPSRRNLFGSPSPPSSPSRRNLFGSPPPSPPHPSRSPKRASPSSFLPNRPIKKRSQVRDISSSDFSLFDDDELLEDRVGKAEGMDIGY